MKFELRGSFSAKVKEDAIVVFARASAAKGKQAAKTSVLGAPDEVENFLSGANGSHTKLPEWGETLFFRSSNLLGSKHLLVVGLGDRQGDEAVREASATMVKNLAAEKVQSTAIHFDSLGSDSDHSPLMVRALVEGAKLGGYKFDDLKSQKDTDKKPTTGPVFAIYGSDLKAASAKQALSEGEAMAEAVNFARWMGDMPANYMTPTRMAQEAQKKGKATSGLKVTVWDRNRIKKERMGGLYGVARGSDEEPRFIIMEYKGAGPSKKPVCFVGKGLTFDCGGVSIKPSASMEEMKYDMCGGAAVIATMWAIARMKLKVNAIGLVPSTENMINGRATKPGDVHIARNGKSFEVNNTDAEGRLILADALCYATERKPELIVDAATLTGAMVIALGNTHTGFFTRNNELKERVERSAKASGEWVWAMPLTDYHVKDMQGTFADLSNLSSFRGAGSATAAAFLEQFVGSDIPWAHFDIAGTAWNCGNRQSYQPKKGATGAIVRTFVELARS